MHGRPGVAIALILASWSRMASASTPASEITLATVPPMVYRVSDPGRMRTESWMFHLVVADTKAREGIRPLRAELEIFTGALLRETLTLPESTLALKRTTSYRITPQTDTLALQRRLSLDEVFDLRFVFLARPIAWKVDRVRITLTLAVPGEKNAVRALDVPVRSFEQKTKLVFPMQGPAAISQGQFNNLGHAGHSNQFAIDVLGLDANYGPWASGRTGNEEYAGFGREILAPAGGRVVHARNDVPDNTSDVEPATVYRKLPQPMLATVGNCVVVDHGNGEFSALMHLQQGSVKVAVGDVVQQGQPIGRLGNSGDAFGPHLHYQLQDGPELLRANSLPARFDNLSNVDLSRGTYFRPR